MKVMSDKPENNIIEEENLMCLEDIKQYIGIFTGKTVKPSEGWEDNLKDFQKGDKVIVFNLKDFGKFLENCNRIIKREFDKK